MGRHAGAQDSPHATGLPPGVHSGGDTAGSPSPPCMLLAWKLCYTPLSAPWVENKMLRQLWWPFLSL